MLNSISLYKNEILNQEIEYMSKVMDLCFFARCMSNKYGKKLVDTAKKSATDAIKTASKRTIQKLLKQLVT